MSWTAEQRGIFEYTPPGGPTRFADPLRVRRDLLVATAGRFDDLWADYRGTSPACRDLDAARAAAFKADAAGRVAEAVRAAFPLKPVNPETGEGVADEYCLALAASFLTWVEKKRTNSGSGPTTSTCTAGLRGPSPEDMASLSGSCSTGRGCECATPTT